MDFCTLINHLKNCCQKNQLYFILFRIITLFVCYVALRPKSTAMVMAGWSVHISPLFTWTCLNKHIISLVTDNKNSKSV